MCICKAGLQHSATALGMQQLALQRLLAALQLDANLNKQRTRGAARGASEPGSDG